MFAREPRVCGRARLHAMALMATVLVAAIPQRASAQASWLVTEVRAGESSATKTATAERVVELLRARGAHVVDGRTAASEIELKHSRSPVRLQPEELEKLDGALRTLADHLASENLPEARTALEAVERLTPDARDYLNRQLNRARRRFHTCLLAAHLFAKEGYDDDAFQQVRKCARDFPGFEPEEGAYMPESIKSFFSRARKELQSIRPSTLHIDLESGSGRERCRARVNGIDKGPLPATIADIRADQVRVQIDCDGRSGRIYNFNVEPGDNSVRLDPRLDRALDTSSALLLSYPDGVSARDLRVKHGLRLARSVGAGHVLQVLDGRLHRLDVESQGEVGQAAYSEEDLDDAVSELFDATPAPALTQAGPVGASSGDPSRTSTAPFAPLAWVSLGLSGAAGAATIIAWQIRESAADDFNAENCVVEDDPTRPTRAETCSDSLGTVKSAETAMIVGGITTGTFVALTTVFFVLDATIGRNIEHASVAPCMPGPGDIGLACRVMF